MPFFYTIFYFLFAWIMIYPPMAFISMGLTLPRLFSSFLGSENESFIQFHIKRSVLTIFAHSCLPLGYIIGMIFYEDEVSATSFQIALWKIFLTLAIILPVHIAYKIFQWSYDDWSDHPICKSLTKFCTQDLTWKSLATTINEEFKSVDKISLNINGTTKTIVTNNWIIKVNFYGMSFAQQNDAIMIVKESETHHLSPTTGGEQQFINIEVKSSQNVPVFNIRLNSFDFKDLQSKVRRPIVILPHIVFHKTIIDKFIDVFKDNIISNQKYPFRQDLEPCIGCMQNIANVKLYRCCLTPEINRQNDDIPCQICDCRPMWCADCMGRWFATRQDPDHPETWLGSKCTCPLCRRVFCILDVCYVEQT